MSSSELPSVGFIGTGVMGGSMAGHLLDAGYPLTVFNRTRSKAAGLLERGASWAASPAEVAKANDVVITIVGFPADVESTFLGDDGLVAQAQSGTLLIDMTTSSPKLARQIAAAASERNLSVLDAPVSGGDRGAREATLSIMVGGEVSAYNRALPLLQTMGRTIVHQGEAGSGQHCKMANQIAIASGMVGVCESLTYAKTAGLDPNTVLNSISGGAAGSWSLNNLTPRMIAHDFAPGFYVKHFIKDLWIAIESARELNLELPGLELARRLYEKLAADGHENEGTQALIRLYQ